jgi:agmatinase
VSVPAIRAAWERHPGLAVVHFDAHTDLREDYLGEKLSHASAMRRAHEFLGDGAIWQFGIRSGTKEEYEWAAAHTHMHPFTLGSVPEAVRVLGGRPIYVTVDMDVLDPSEFPGTGTPEAGGVTFNELARALTALKGLDIVGADAVELSPHYDQSGISTAAACKVVRELALLMVK